MSYFLPSEAPSGVQQAPRSATDVALARSFGPDAEVVPSHYLNPRDRPYRYETVTRPRSTASALHHAAHLPGRFQGAAHNSLKQSLREPVLGEAFPPAAMERQRSHRKRNKVARSNSMPAAVLQDPLEEAQIQDDLNVQLPAGGSTPSKPAGNPFAATPIINSANAGMGSELQRAVSLPASNLYQTLFSPGILESEGSQQAGSYFQPQAPSRHGAIPAQPAPITSYPPYSQPQAHLQTPAFFPPSAAMPSAPTPAHYGSRGRPGSVFVSPNQPPMVIQSGFSDPTSPPTAPSQVWMPGAATMSRAGTSVSRNGQMYRSQSKAYTNTGANSATYPKQAPMSVYGAGSVAGGASTGTGAAQPRAKHQPYDQWIQHPYLADIEHQQQRNGLMCCCD